MKRILTQLIFITSILLMTSCGKNIMNSSFFTKEQLDSNGASSVQGYWKSTAFEIDANGEIDQNIYLQDQINLNKSNRSVFDQELKNYQCSQVKDLESVKAISVELHLFVQYDQYYMIADLTYTTNDDQKLRCPGVLGQRKFN